MDSFGVDPPRKLVGGGGGARIAPPENRRQRPAASVEREQAVAEARRADSVECLPCDCFVDCLPNEGDDVSRIVLAGVLTPGCSVLLCIRSEDLGADG